MGMKSHLSRHKNSKTPGVKHSGFFYLFFTILNKISNLQKLISDGFFCAINIFINKK
tara:strand:- start:295 stop:465 length:171 start_codon:yes stop_codon:yes gene_type:complete